MLRNKVTQSLLRREPSNLGSIELQVQRALARLRSIGTPLEKYTFLDDLKFRNEAVFYGLIGSHLNELTPLIYTPLIGLVCQKFSLIHPPSVASLLQESNDASLIEQAQREPTRALYLVYDDKDTLPDIISNLTTRADPDKMQICVVTDGSRVLGLGDLGVGGMGISMGKLSLYVAAGGIHPSATLPIVLDFGTDNEELLADPLYIGVRKRRISDEDAQSFVEVFMAEMHKKFPNMIIQFEDWHTTLAFPLLQQHRDRYPCFNDDIQGTGAVILAGAIKAFEVNGVEPKDQKVVFFGAGSSGVGVAETIARYFVSKGFTEEEARSKFYLVDSKGLVAKNRGDKLPIHKEYLARRETDLPALKTLDEVIDFVKPTALMGLSTVGGAFSPEILKKMAKYNKHPIVFALSNPIDKAECTFEEAVENTNGTVLFASGSPFDDVHYEGKVYHPGQGNNMYIFPGLGLGALHAQVKTIPEEIILQTAQSLSDSLNEEETAEGYLYPNIDRIREVSAKIATDIVIKCQELNIDRNTSLRGKTPEEIHDYIADSMYRPLLN